MAKPFPPAKAGNPKKVAKKAMGGPPPPLARPKLPPKLGGANPHEKGYTVVGKPGGAS